MVKRLGLLCASMLVFSGGVFGQEVQPGLAQDSALRGSFQPQGTLREWERVPHSITTISAMIEEAGQASPELSRRFGSSAGSGAGAMGFRSDLAFSDITGQIDEDSPLQRAPLRRARAFLEEDPFAPVGIKLGAFRFYPMVELSAGVESNPLLEVNRRPSAFGAISSAMRFESDWVRHRLNAQFGGTYTDYARSGVAARPTGFGRVDAVFDVLRDTRIEISAVADARTESPGSPDLPDGLANEPLVATASVTAGVVQTLGKTELGVRTSYERAEYEDGRLRNGRQVSNRDRDVSRQGIEFVAGYEITPGVRPFVSVGVDERIFDQNVDDEGYVRDSSGTTAQAGASFALTNWLTGRASIGYTHRDYEDLRLANLETVFAEGSLVWRATGLTTITVAAQSEVDDSTLPGIAGLIRQGASIQIDHAFRRYLIGTAQFGIAVEHYEGSVREDTRTSARLGLAYYMNRTTSVRGEYRYEKLKSNIPGNDYTTNIALVGMRFQR